MSTMTVAIPATPLPSGVTVLGPVSVPDGWHLVEVSLDIANLVALVDVVLEWSLDAVTWLPLASALGLNGPGFDSKGVLQTDPHFTVTFGENNPAAQVRATLTNYGLPLLTAGGTLKVS